MIRCTVVDDEPQAVQLLVNYIEKSKDLELVGSFTNPIEAFHFLNDNPTDLLFLDIQMPELSGIQLLKLLGKKSSCILTTAYEQYALEGFEMDVVDYLLKPVSFELFLRSVGKYKERFQNNKSDIESKASDTEFIFIKSGYRTLRINYSEIFYIEALSDYVAIHLKNDKILTLETMNSFTEILPKDQFIRVHRSYIVSISKINFIERNRIRINNQYIPISKTYQSGFWKVIGHK